MAEGAPGRRRVFVAVPLDETTRGDLASLLVARMPRGVPGRAVAPENWHLTLRFIGYVEEPTLDRAVAALDAAELGAGFRLRLGPLGAFPNARRARVLWVGLDEGGEQAALLAERVEDALEAAGLEPSDRPFRAHLTISRLRPTQDVTSIVEPADPVGLAFPVDRVTLYESHLGRGGARYEVVEEFLLR